MFSKLKPYRKAIVAALATGLAVFLKAESDNVITTAEWVEIAFAVLGGGGLTWLVPNAPQPALPPMSERHRL